MSSVSDVKAVSVFMAIEEKDCGLASWAYNHIRCVDEASLVVDKVRCDRRDSASRFTKVP